MATIIPFPIEHVADDELAVRLWELAMAGERGSDAFMHIKSQLRRRSASGPRAAGTACDPSSQRRFGVVHP